MKSASSFIVPGIKGVELPFIESNTGIGDELKGLPFQEIHMDINEALGESSSMVVNITGAEILSVTANLVDMQQAPDKNNLLSHMFYSIRYYQYHNFITMIEPLQILPICKVFFYYKI